MKRYYVYPAIFHPEEIGFSVFFPDLKGCQTQGETMEEATLMAQEALGAYLECLMEDGKPVPSPSSPKSLSLSSDDFVAMISVDIFTIKDKANGKAVKKTLTIPSWLNEEAEKYHINFSSVLREALIERISE
jgi:antitoxin HicB